ncbi:MAG: hypothetical protein ABWK15_06215 [Dissulfuribacterales bacterium]
MFRFFYVFFFGCLLSILAGWCSSVEASQTVGSVDLRIINATDIYNQPIIINQPILSFDVDFGYAFLNLYGTACSENGVSCTPLIGSGHYYNAATGQELRIGLKIGTKEYRIHFPLSTMTGILAIYDKDGNMEAGATVIVDKVY